MESVEKEIRYVVNDLKLTSDEFDEFRSYLLERDIQHIYSEYHFFDCLSFEIVCKCDYYESFAINGTKKALVEAGLIGETTKIDAL